MSSFKWLPKVSLGKSSSTCRRAIITAKTRPYTIKLQIVCAVAQGVAAISKDEVPIIEEAFRTGARKLSCDILSTSAGDRWFQVFVATEAAFDVPKAMTSLKAVSSRAMHAKRGGDSGFWSSGYVVVSVGEPVDPADAAAKLEGRSNRH